MFKFKKIMAISLFAVSFALICTPINAVMPVEFIVREQCKTVYEDFNLLRKFYKYMMLTSRDDMINEESDIYRNKDFDKFYRYVMVSYKNNTVYRKRFIQFMELVQDGGGGWGSISMGGPSDMDGSLSG